MLPMDWPLQLSLTWLVVNVTAVGWLTAIVRFEVQPFTSCTVTVCEPAVRPVNWYGDVWVEYDPPSMLTCSAPDTPDPFENVAVTLPSLPFVQLTSVSLRLRFGCGLTVNVPLPDFTAPYGL